MTDTAPARQLELEEADRSPGPARWPIAYDPATQLLTFPAELLDTLGVVAANARGRVDDRALEEAGRTLTEYVDAARLARTRPLPAGRQLGAVDAELDAPAREHGAETSKAAAKAVEVKAGDLRALALAELIAAGDGLTDAELRDRMAEALDRPHLNHSTAGTRRGELVRLGMAADTGATRPSPAGHPAKVWTATRTGVRQLAELDRRAYAVALRRRTAADAVEVAGAGPVLLFWHPPAGSAPRLAAEQLARAGWPTHLGDLVASHHDTTLKVGLPDPAPADRPAADPAEEGDDVDPGPGF